ncbi:MAG: glyoxalase [Dehalococcoidia bacterium]|nr:glyoxalase [Dehalococcoidia bacterium]
MPTMIFVNLPVKDLARSTEFYKGLGFDQNMQFSDENASSIVISDTIHVMLLREDYFATFTSNPIAAPSTGTQAIYALSRDSREDVDALLGKVQAAGGQEPREASEMDGMYGRTFQDPDGHLWEAMWMDPDALQ